MLDQTIQQYWLKFYATPKQKEALDYWKDDITTEI